MLHFDLLVNSLSMGLRPPHSTVNIALFNWYLLYYNYWLILLIMFTRVLLVFCFYYLYHKITYYFSFISSILYLPLWIYYLIFVFCFLISNSSFNGFLIYFTLSCNYFLIFFITNEISFTIISLSSDHKLFLESWFFIRDYYFITNYIWNLLRFTLYIRY